MEKSQKEIDPIKLTLEYASLQMLIDTKIDNILTRYRIPAPIYTSVVCNNLMDRLKLEKLYGIEMQL
jgi:hypothetical protein